MLAETVRRYAAGAGRNDKQDGSLLQAEVRIAGMLTKNAWGTEQEIMGDGQEVGD